MNNNMSTNVRSLTNGHWFWMDKQVVQAYVPVIGAVGFAVYGYLASLTNTRQSCFPSQGRIGKAIGYSRATVNRAIKKLAAEGLIHVEKRDGSRQVYHLLAVRCRPAETQMSSQRNSPVKQVNTNKKKEQEIDTNMEIASKAYKDYASEAYKEFTPGSREELLALDLAEGLDDRQNLPVYVLCARQHPESLLRRALGAAREVPKEKIRKSRAALFHYLLKTYEHKSANNLSH